MFQRIALDLLDGALTNTASGSIDDAQQSNRVLRAEQHLEIRKQIFDFGALIEAEAADDQIFAAVASKRLFNLPRLEICAIKNGDALERISDRKSVV